jgi:uncharacterized membrane protein YgcG
VSNQAVARAVAEGNAAKEGAEQAREVARAQHPGEGHRKSGNLGSRTRFDATLPLMQVMPRPWVVCATVLLAVPGWALGYTPPPIKGHVTDTAGKLAPADVARLEAKLAGYRQCSTNHLAVFLTPSLEGQTIEDVAYGAFNTWKLGEAGKDNGVLLVIAPSERKVRIETGRGVGGKLTDLQSSDIIRTRVSPHLAAGDFAGAIDDGTNGIEQALGLCAGQAAVAPVRAKTGRYGWGDIPLPLTLAGVSLLLLLFWRTRPPVFLGAFALCFVGPMLVIPVSLLGPIAAAVEVALLAVLSLLLWSRQRKDPTAGTFASWTAGLPASSGSSDESSSYSSGSGGSSGDSGYSGGGGSSGGGGASGDY